MTVQKPASLQLIIRFRDDVRDPAEKDFMTRLSQDAGAALVYVRPLSGGAHVLRTTDKLDATQMNAVIERLSRRSDVVFVEQDRKMKRQEGAR